MDRLFSFIGEISYYTSASLMQVALATEINAFVVKVSFYMLCIHSYIFYWCITYTHTHIYICCKLGLFCEEIYQKIVYWFVCFHGVPWIASEGSHCCVSYCFLLDAYYIQVELPEDREGADQSIGHWCCRHASSIWYSIGFSWSLLEILLYLQLR